MTEVIAKIRKFQTQSNEAWDMAIETAGPEYSGGSIERQDAMQSLADTSEGYYEDAIEALEAGDYASAIEALGQAKSCESEGGDCSYASSALEALNELDLVTVETMPGCLVSSHLAANNWGCYPSNGAERELMPREAAQQVVADDPYKYAMILE